MRRAVERLGVKERIKDFGAAFNPPLVIAARTDGTLPVRLNATLTRYVIRRRRRVAGEQKLAGDCAMFSFLNRRRGVARSPIRLFRLGWGEIRLTLVFLTNGRFAPEPAAHPEPIFLRSPIRNEKPRGHCTAWPSRDCPPMPSRDSVLRRLACGRGAVGHTGRVPPRPPALSSGPFLAPFFRRFRGAGSWP
jgi:hypothetical protein